MGIVRSHFYALKGRVDQLGDEGELNCGTAGWRLRRLL
jgi:hypothetical protein